MKKVIIIMISLQAFKMYSIMVGRWGDWGYSVVNSTEEKPFVYRVLVPITSRIVGFVLDEKPERMMEFTFVVSAVFFFLAMMYFYEAFYEGGKWIAFVSFEILIIMCWFATKVYDYASAAFFALSFGFLARNKHRAFLILFPFATLNRETTFLLIIFYAVWFFGKIPNFKYFLSLAYQVFVYLLEKIIIQIIFSNNGGKPIYFEFFQVVSVYARFWFVLIAILPIVYMVIKSWNEVPEFLQVAALTIVPAQILLHLLFGNAFEIRVFVESVPILAVFLDRFIYLQRIGQVVFFPRFKPR